MKNEEYNDEEFEAMLRDSLKPQKPGWETDRLVLESILLKDEDSIKKQRLKSYLRNSWIASLGMVAAIAITMVFFTQLRTEEGFDGTAPSNAPSLSLGPSGTSEVTTANFRAVGAQNKLLGVQDKGWTDASEDSVTRELKYQYLDTVDMVNEEDGSMMRVEIPREEIVNVTYQVI